MIHFLKNILCRFCARRRDPAPPDRPHPLNRDLDDLRTVQMPLDDGRAMTYYEVAKLWNAEAMRAKKLIRTVISGDIDCVLPNHFKSAQFCDLGVWLEHVHVPSDRRAIFDDLRLWHSLWHEGSERLFLQVNEGKFDDAQSVFKTRDHPWHYAKRKVDKLLNAIWCGDSGENTLNPATQVPIQVASSTPQIPTQHAS